MRVLLDTNVARKIKGVDMARQMVDGLLAACQVCPIDLPILQSALTLPVLTPQDFLDQLNRQV